MEDGFELAPLVRVREHDCSQGAPVELARGGQHVLAEAFGHRAESRLPGRDDRTRGIVGVDHRNPELGESLLDHALAARDSAGKADAQRRRHQCLRPDRRR